MRCYKTLLSNLCSINCQTVAYDRLKELENFKLEALKVVAVAYEGWTLTRGSNAVIRLGTFLYFEKLVALSRGGRLQQVVATGGLTVYSSTYFGAVGLQTVRIKISHTSVDLIFIYLSNRIQCC